MLERIYGRLDPDRCRGDLYEFYDYWQVAADEIDEVYYKGCSTAEDCQKKVVRRIAKEIGKLKKYAREKTSIDAIRTELEILSRGVPLGQELDRILRYRKDLERESRSIRDELSQFQRNHQHQSLEPKSEGQVDRRPDRQEERQEASRDSSVGKIQNELS